MTASVRCCRRGPSGEVCHLSRGHIALDRVRRPGRVRHHAWAEDGSGLRRWYRGAYVNQAQTAAAKKAKPPAA